MPVAHEDVVTGNRLLRALPHMDRARLAERLERVAITRGEVLQQPGEPITTVHFPLTAAVSIVQTVGDDDINELVTVGNDGMVGMAGFLARTTSPWRAFCQIPGEVLSMPADLMGDVTTASHGVRDVLGRYSLALLAASGGNFSCTQLHSVAQRCSRWILVVRRQVGRDEFPLTQQSLATMLGVRRATVSVTAGALQAAGLIQYHHGVMRIIDPAAMEDAACDCYGIITNQFDRLFPPTG